MRKVLAVARHELFVNVRRPSYIIVTLAVPAVGLVGILLAVYFGRQIAGTLVSQFEAGTSRPIGYVDRSGWLRIEENSSDEAFHAFDSEAEARAALDKGDISSFFVISDDYLETGKAIRYVRGRGILGFDELDRERIHSFLRDNLLENVGDPTLRARLRDPVNLSTVDLAGDEEKALNPLDFVVPYAFSVLLVISIFTSSGFLLQSVTEEKENRVVEVLLSSLSPMQLMVGKILGLGILGLIQVVVWFGAVWGLGGVAAASFAVLSGFRIPLSVATLSTVYFLLGYLLFAAFMAAAGAASTTLREGQQVAGIVSIVAAVPFMLTSLLFANPDSVVIKILSYFPLTAPIMMMQRLALDEVAPLEIASSIGLLVAGIIVGMWGAAKIFRMGILMYGQRLGVRQFWTALRQA
ncbi:MAG: ABC transporter permease [Anaerolineae bacterium]